VTSYTVVQGDTFASIAQRLYGDSSFAHLLQMANAWVADEQLPEGLRLVIPPCIPVHNGVGTAEPYQKLMSIIIGTVYPHLDTPQPPPPHHSFWRSLVSVVVGVVVAVVAPHLLVIVLPMLTTTSTVIVAMSAALASAASQGVAVGLGVQDHFSWNSVATAALTSGLTQGLGGNALPRGDILQDMLTYGKIAVAEQLSEMALGFRHKFDLREVLTSMLAQTADVELGLNDKDFGHVASQTGVNSAIGAIVMGQTPDINMLAAQAIGSALGNSIGTPLANDIDEYRKHRAEEVAKAQQAAQGKTAKPETQPAQRSSQANPRPVKRGYKLFDNPEMLEAALWANADFNLDTDITADDMQQAFDKSLVAERRIRWQAQPTTNKDWSASLTRYTDSLPGRLQQNFMDEFTDPNTSIAAIVDYTAKKVVQLDWVNKYTRYEGYAQAGALRVTENIGDFSKASLMSERYAGLAAKYGFYARGAAFIQGTGKLVLPVDIMIGLGNVAEAEPSSRMRTVFEETGRIAGGVFGASLGVFEGIAEEITIPVISTPVAIGGIVVQTSAGAALGKEVGRDVYIYGAKAIDYIHEKYQPN
jgi:phage tail protein X